MSHLEDTMAQQIRLAGLPIPTREFVAIPSRRFRWDFAGLNSVYSWRSREGHGARAAIPRALAWPGTVKRGTSPPWQGGCA